MSAREIIKGLAILNGTWSNATKADAILEALTAAGYRIIAPGELDRETLERAEDSAEAFADQHDVAAIHATTGEAISRFRGGEKALRSFASAIRALQQEEKR